MFAEFSVKISSPSIELKRFNLGFMLSFSPSFVPLVGLKGIVLSSKQVNLNVSCVIICKLCTILFSPRTFYWRGSLQVRMDFVSKFSGVWCLPDFMNNFASSFCVFTLRQLHHLLVVLEHQERYGSSSDVICQPSVLPSYLPPSLYVHFHGLLNTDHS
jgi:hypothetical protein